MGLDGFSMGNLGLNVDMTSAQMASQAEHLAKKESQFKIKDVEEMVHDKEIERKDEHSRKQDQQDSENKKKQQEENSESSKEKLALIEQKFENQDLKEFSIRINSNTDLIELFNNKEEKIMETISAADLMHVLSKLDSASGVLVNRKI